MNSRFLMAALGRKLPLGLLQEWVESRHLKTDEGTAQQANRSSGMAYTSDRPADQMKLEARLFQEELRRALASSRKVTKLGK